MVATTRAGRAVHLALKMPSPVKIKAVVSRKKKRVTFGPSEDAATSKKRKTKAAGVMEGLDELARAASASTSANGGAEDSGKKETAEKKRIRSTNKSEFVVVARVKYSGSNYDELFLKLKHASVHTLTKGQDYYKKNRDYVQHYMCLHNKVGCGFKGKLVHVKETDEVIVSVCGLHDLDAHNKRTTQNGMTSVQKDYVKSKTRSKVHPETIRDRMLEESPSKNLGAGGYPTLTTIQNFVRKMAQTRTKEEAFGNTLAELRDFCETHSVVPNDDDETFVVAYNTRARVMFGFQCTRKCKHVLARALRDGLFTVPPDMKLGVVAKPKSAGGRAKRAGKALEPESSESEEEDDGFSECSSDDSGEDDIE
ncbi:hypothetical protein PPROV_000146100 [Pycnococcus provasolii]|uniref:Uncharacterized protein n=1 Tax=Pycnococcus provasolii TaxID=41880 RepID=A0A830H667_9CHLO|nr:hypothetical protein PPROV_000146100 [Pycnococcus provasolii]